MTQRRSGWLATTTLAVGMVGGCSATAERPLSAGLFLPGPSAKPAPVVRAPVNDDEAARPAGDVVANGGPTTAESPKKAMILTPTSDFDAVRPLEPLQSAGPTTAPVATVASDVQSPVAPEPAADGPTPSGVYQTVGGIVARVNDTPIYSHTVLALLDKELASRARDLGPEEFRQFATGRIFEQVQELVQDEQVYALAYKALTDDDRKLVTANMTAMRQEAVKQAGGSLELARRAAADEGYDFDELMKRDHRRLVVAVYSQRMVEPLVQVSAADLREYYAAVGAKRYGSRDQLQFRVVKIDPAKMPAGTSPPRVDALVQIRDVRRRAVAGEDFKALASSANQEKGMRESGGDPGGWMDRGAYRFDAVEAALWQLQPGGVTDVIEAEGLFFVAKLEDKHQGGIKPFEDPAVQADMYKQLAQQQRASLMFRLRSEADDDAASPVKPDLTPAVELAMQKYERWKGNAR